MNEDLSTESSDKLLKNYYFIEPVLLVIFLVLVHAFTFTSDYFTFIVIFAIFASTIIWYTHH